MKMPRAMRSNTQLFTVTLRTPPDVSLPMQMPDCPKSTNAQSLTMMSSLIISTRRPSWL